MVKASYQSDVGCAVRTLLSTVIIIYRVGSIANQQWDQNVGISHRPIHINNHVREDEANAPASAQLLHEGRVANIVIPCYTPPHGRDNVFKWQVPTKLVPAISSTINIKAQHSRWHAQTHAINPHTRSNIARYIQSFLPKWRRVYRSDTTRYSDNHIK